MRPLTLREALGGPWAAHWVIWLMLFVPTTLMVVIREWVTPFPDWWAWVAVSAFTQHALVGVILVLGVRIARRWHVTIPLQTALAIWTVAAVARAVLAGGIASTVAGVDPFYLERITAWVLASMTWIPVVVYTVAQLDRRRLLLGAIDRASSELSAVRAEAARSAAETRGHLLGVVSATLEPVLDDLRASLGATRGVLDPTAVAELSLRLSRLLDDTSSLIDSGLPPTEPAASARERATVRRAFDLEPARPWLVALLVTVSTAAFIVPDVLTIFGPRAALEVVIATVAAGLVIGAVPALARLAHSQGRQIGQRSTVIGSVAGIIIATYLLLNSGIDPVTWHGLLVAPLLAVCLVTACTVFIAALVLSGHNSEAASLLDTIKNQVRSESARHQSTAIRERQRLGELVHGPVQGRLAACVMALNFWSAGAADDNAGREVTESVLEHLSAVSRDLVLLSTGATLSPPEVGRE